MEFRSSFLFRGAYGRGGVVKGGLKLRIMWCFSKEVF